jgi:hypothetical protein
MAKKLTAESTATPNELEAQVISDPIPPEDLQPPITTPVESIITQEDIAKAEPMLPKAIPNTNVMDIADVPRAVRIALFRACDKLCGEVQIRRFERKKQTYEIDIMMKQLSEKFGQLKGSRKLVTGIEVPLDETKISVDELADDIRILARF